MPVPVDDPVLGRRIQMMQMDVDPVTLQQIARRTGGRFYRATDAGALAGIYGEIDRLERVPVRSIVYREYRDLASARCSGAAALLLARGRAARPRPWRSGSREEAPVTFADPRWLWRSPLCRCWCCSSWRRARRARRGLARLVGERPDSVLRAQVLAGSRRAGRCCGWARWRP